MIQENEAAFKQAVIAVDTTANELRNNVLENDMIRNRIEAVGGTVSAELRALAYNAAASRLSALEANIVTCREVFDATVAVD